MAPEDRPVPDPSVESPATSETAAAEVATNLARYEAIFQLALGCGSGQGYLFARPMTEHAMAEFLAEHHPAYRETSHAPAPLLLRRQRTP